MSWVSRCRCWWAGVVAAVALVLSGCGLGLGEAEEDADADADAPTIGVLPDSYGWPVRGSLAEDPEVRREVAGLVEEWRTPDGAAGGESSALLWAGEVDGVVLAMVDFRPQDNRHHSWLLEIVQGSDGLAVVGARSHPRSLLDDDLLPIRSAGVGPRYLVSARAASLETADGPLEFDQHGLTDRVEVPECRLTALHGRRATRDFVAADFGRGIQEPSYPVFQESRAAGAAEVMADVDMCAAMATDGWLGSGGREGRPAMLHGAHPYIFTLMGDPLSSSDSAGMPGKVGRVFAEYLNRDGLRSVVTWLVWTYSPDAGVAEVRGSPASEVVTDEPGLFVMRLPSPTEEEIQVEFTVDGEPREVTVS